MPHALPALTGHLERVISCTGSRSSGKPWRHPQPRPPLLERRREIVAGQAKERKAHGMTAPGKTLVENLPPASDKTRDSIAAEIGVSNTRSNTRPAILSKLLRML